MPCLTPAASGTPPPHGRSAAPVDFDALKLLRPPFPRPKAPPPRTGEGPRSEGPAEDALLLTLVTGMAISGLIAFALLQTWAWYL